MSHIWSRLAEQTCQQQENKNLQTRSAEKKKGVTEFFFLYIYIYHTKHLPSSISHLSARILVEKRASRGVVACWSWTESSWTGDGAEQRRWEWVQSGCLWTRRPVLHRLWCEWAEEEQRDRPGWRSLGLVSVPAAWGPARGLRLGNLSLSDPTERARQRVKEGGRGRLKGRAMAVFATYSTTNPCRRPGRSAGLTFIRLVPEAIRQFSWETAAEIYICLGVSTHQPPSVCVPPLVDSIFKSSASISVWCQPLNELCLLRWQARGRSGCFLSGDGKRLPSIVSSCVDNIQWDYFVWISA